jgi:hypothetical protein
MERQPDCAADLRFYGWCVLFKSMITSLVEPKAKRLPFFACSAPISTAESRMSSNWLLTSAKMDHPDHGIHHSQVGR